MRRDVALSTLSAHQDDLRRFAVRSLFLFGSVARDDARPDSDVDLIVEFERPTGLLGLSRLRSWLEDLLHARVDLVTSAGLDPRLRSRIQSEAIHVA